MALDLNEYIKMSYERPNRKVLEGLGASEDLIEYLMETPRNTNWNVLNGMSGNEETFELPHKIYFINYYDNSFDTTKTSLKTEDDIIAWVNENEGSNIEFYSSYGQLMSFTKYDSKTQAYLWDATDGSGEFVWVYNNLMDHYYDG